MGLRRARSTFWSIGAFRLYSVEEVHAFRGEIDSLLTHIDQLEAEIARMNAHNTRLLKDLRWQKKARFYEQQSRTSNTE